MTDAQQDDLPGPVRTETGGLTDRGLRAVWSGIDATKRQLLLVALAYVVTRIWLVHEVGWLGGATDYQDVNLYHLWVIGIAHTHHLPTTSMWQYPVGAALLFLLGNVVPAHFTVVFCLLMFACDLGITATLARVAVREGRFRGVYLWLALTVALGPMFVERFDLAPTFALVLALSVTSTRGRQMLFGVLLGAGVLLKVWPILGALAAETRRSLASILVWCLVTVLVVTAISSIFLGDTLGFISNQSVRGLEVEAVAASPWFLHQALTHTALSTMFSSGALEIRSSLASDIASVMRVVMVLVALGLAGWWFRQTRRGRALSISLGRDAVFAATLWYLVVSPVLSPQYLIWVAGLAAICLCSRETIMQRPVALVAVAVVITRLILEKGPELLGTSTSVSVDPGRVLALALVARNLLLLAAAVEAFWLLLRPERARPAGDGLPTLAERATAWSDRLDGAIAPLVARPGRWLSSSRKWHGVDVATMSLMVLAAAVSVVHLGTKSLWADETVSADYARMSLGGIWHVVTGPDPNMSLYYFLLHFWAGVFGYTETALRSMSAVAACLSIPLMVAVGTKLFDRHAGLLAGLLMAVDACFVAYAQEARSYSMLVFLTLASTYLFLRAIENPSKGRIAGYVVVSVLSVYAHYFAVLVLLVQFVTLMSSGEWRRQGRRWIVSGVVIAAGCIPEALLSPNDTSNVSWITKPTLHDLIAFPNFLTGSSSHSIPAGLAALLLGLLALYWLWTEWNGECSWQTRFTGAWLVLPVALTFVESRLGRSFWVDYYLIIVLPPLLLLGAAGALRLPFRTVAVGIVLVVVAMLLVNLKRLYAAGPEDNYRAAAQFIFASAGRDDGGLYGPSLNKPAAAVTDPGIAYYGHRLNALPPRPVSLRELERGGAGVPRRVWLVARYDEQTDARLIAGVEHAVAAHYAAVGSPHDFEVGPTVVLLQRRRT